MINRRTLLREAEERLKRTRDPMEIVDMLHILEASATHFFLRAQMAKNAGRKQSDYVDRVDTGLNDMRIVCRKLKTPD